MAEMNFKVMTMKQGLPHDSVYWVTQGNPGYIWIATFGGISRFDAYGFRSYLHDPDDPTSLPDNNVRVILPCRNGDLYAGTGGSGLVLYAAATDTFSIPNKTPEQVRKARVYSLAADGQDGVWFGMQNGLGHYRPATQDFEIFGKLSGRRNDVNFPEGTILSVLQDSKGNLWVGSDTGLYERTAGQNEFRFIPGLKGPGEIGEAPSVWVLKEDSSGRLWVGTDGSGIGLYDAPTNHVRGVKNLSGAESAFGPHTIRAIVEAQPGVFWIATYGAGLFSYNSEKQALLHWGRNPTALLPLSNDFVRSLFIDSSGVMWAGTDVGVSSVSLMSQGIFNMRTSSLHPADLAQRDRLFGTEVRSVGYDTGSVWVGFDQGGFVQIAPDGSTHRIQPAPGVREDQRSHREVLAMYPLDANTMIAAGVGLYSINIPSRTYRPIDHPELNKQIINAVYCDGDTIWAGRYSGLVRYNWHTHQVKVFRHTLEDPNSISDNYIRDMLKDSHGRFWASTRLGLDLYQPATEAFQHITHDPKNPLSIASDNVQPIEEDKQGRLWVGTIGSGLSILENWPEGGQPRFKTLDHKHNGLPDDVVLLIRRGLDGTMWVNTPHGMAAIDPKTYTVRVYGDSYGLQTTAQNLFSSALLPDGTILFPGNASLAIVRPNLLHPWNLKAPLVLTEVHVQGAKEAPVQLAQQAVAGILRFPSHRGFDVEFSLLDYTSPAETLYSYQLEGFDDGWSSPSTSRRSATYTNLPTGNYQFHIRATSRHGAGPTSEIAVPIHVSPGITESWWFQTLVTLIALTAVLFFVRLRLIYMTRRQRELETEVVARTAELELSRQELLAANEHLEKLALYDPLTSILNRRGFFERVEFELMRAKRSGQAFSLLLIDLDNFKQTNDIMGHSAGDAVLKSVAVQFAQSVRATDIVGRYGGEEFVVFLPETDQEAAHQLADRLRSAVENHLVQHAELTLNTTASIGVTTSLHIQEPLETLLSRADRALYQAKNSGKNRVCLA